MGSLIFPDVACADEDGFIGISEAFSGEDLVAAYTRGVFPWPWTPQYVGWFSPPQRGILEFPSFHLPRSFRKVLRKSPFEIRVDSCFESVLEECAVSVHRRNQQGTWITPHVKRAYTELFSMGLAHSVEVFEGDLLVGGLYGVSLGGYFSGESMFYKRPNASKYALYCLGEFLKGHEILWMDCQVLSPFTKSLGAIDISREEFLIRLKRALSAERPQWSDASFREKLS